MSNYNAMNSYLDREDEIRCECGCLFKVSIVKQDGHNEREEYYCPDCRKEYWAMASLSPSVVKLNSNNSIE
jgi:uncharacterized protein with PIN domain